MARARQKNKIERFAHLLIDWSLRAQRGNPSTNVVLIWRIVDGRVVLAMTIPTQHPNSG